MTKLREQVRVFHERYGQPIGDKPELLTDERFKLRLKLVAEEFVELLEATAGTEWMYSDTEDEYVGDMLARYIDEATYTEPDLVDMCDALADLDYVIEGMRVELGVNGEPIAEEVQRSNLSKLGADGFPVMREDGKVIKGPDFTPPDIAGVLLDQGWEP